MPLILSQPDCPVVSIKEIHISLSETPSVYFQLAFGRRDGEGTYTEVHSRQVTLNQGQAVQFIQSFGDAEAQFFTFLTQIGLYTGEIE